MQLLTLTHGQNIQNAWFYTISLRPTCGIANKCSFSSVQTEFRQFLSAWGVGKHQHYSSPNTVGPHAVDRLNENGQRMVDLCAMNDLIITNTFFEHKGICVRQNRVLGKIEI